VRPQFLFACGCEHVAGVLELRDEVGCSFVGVLHSLGCDLRESAAVPLDVLALLLGGFAG
jgi:hypothetical protein